MSGRAQALIPPTGVCSGFWRFDSPINPAAPQQARLTMASASPAIAASTKSPEINTTANAHMENARIP